jgi:dihydroorotase
MFDLILKNGFIAAAGGVTAADIGVKDGKITAIGDPGMTGREELDVSGLTVLPGVIDNHVHFREPGLTHKEDLGTGTLAAIAGGVTTIFEMPNTDPLTLFAEHLDEKLARAKSRAFCDHAFYIGGSAVNAAQLETLERLPGCAGVKVFMGSSTGDLLAADDETIESIFNSGTRRVSLHAEDNDRLTMRKSIADQSGNVADHPVWRDEETAVLAVRRAVALSRKTARPIHILHSTTAGEMAFLKDHKDVATVETTPQHLTLAAEECYARLGTRAQMNPPIRAKSHQDALWRAIESGVIDTIGSDHAPHTLDEKAKPYPSSPSGMPGVQTLLPVMLNHVHEGRLSLGRLVQLVCENPARIFGVKNKGRIAVGYDADFTVVDLGKRMQITNKWIQSKCGWTPFDGMTVTGWPVGTLLRGRVMMWEGDLTLAKPMGQPVIFNDSRADSARPDSPQVCCRLRESCC